MYAVHALPVPRRSPDREKEIIENEIVVLGEKENNRKRNSSVRRKRK